MTSINKVFHLFKNKEIYLVGGCVRDSLMGVKPKDLDFTTSLVPDEVIAVLKAKNIKAQQVDKQFGTIGFKVDKMLCEITTFRTEIYGKSRKPSVEFVSDLKTDLTRRDFTINAMAMDRNYKLIDYFNGRQDIKDKIIRLIGYKNVFKDDPLRMLRAIRFQSQLNFNLAPKTLNTILHQASLILDISKERQLLELNKLLCGNFTCKALQTFIDSDLAVFMIPELLPMVNLKQPQEYHHKDVWEHTKTVVKNIEPSPVLRWAALLHDIGKPATRTVDTGIHFYKHELVSKFLASSILNRFKSSNLVKNRVLKIISEHMRLVNYNCKWSDKALRKIKKDTGECFVDLLSLAQADISSAKPEKIVKSLTKINKIVERIKDLESKKKLEIKLPKNIGNNIKTVLKIKEGPEIGRLKQKLENSIENNIILANQNTNYYMQFLKKEKNEN